MPSWFRTARNLALLALAAAAILVAAPRKPKLVVVIVVDQFRYDYLTRFRAEYTGGFNRLLTEGAVFSNANYVHVPTITAVGHSTILSGATPAISGIVANDWYDREEGGAVSSVSDPTTQLLGGSAGRGSSPRRLLVSTIGDELKMANGKSHAIGISLKDRSAILPTGATWPTPPTGSTRAAGTSAAAHITSATCRAGARDFNAAHAAGRYKGATWLGHTMPPTRSYTRRSMPPRLETS